MYGSATLAMLVSSTSMKAAIATTTAMSQGLCRGRQTAPAADASELGNSEDPEREAASVIARRGGGPIHRTSTSGTTDMPGPITRFGSGASSIAILTGTRCTTLT